MSADIIPFPTRDDGTVMSAARNLILAAERFERRRAEIDAEAEAWEAERRAAQEAYFSSRGAPRPGARPAERGEKSATHSDGPDAA